MNRKGWLTLSTFAGWALLMLFIHRCTNAPVIRAGVTPLQLSAGDALRYADSTVEADTWQWEFGKGTTARRASGQHHYYQPGQYLIRLTINERYRRTFTVQVKNRPTAQDSTVVLLGPAVGYEDEKLTFTTYGRPASRYAWQFGESGQIDAREPTAIYSYHRPGTYRVWLSTDRSPRPLTRTVRILPKYSRFNPPVDSTANDIRIRLQRIANGQAVNGNYAYLLTRYLCRNAYATVSINGQTTNDFYSYCMGLQFARGTQIEAVAVEGAEAGGCIQKLTVTQRKP